MSVGRVSVEAIKAALCLKCASFPSSVDSPELIHVAFSMLPLLLSLSFISHSTGEICGCVLFNSSGSFHSPDFPFPLSHVDCLFYHFEAPPEHTVQLLFHSFQLPPRRAGSCSSGVRLFDHSSDGFVDIGQPADFEFCDRELPVGKSFYSRDRHFLLQIRHADASSKGFVGEYRFLPKANYSSDAVEISEWTWRVERTSGLLYSPDYPYFYPSSVNATYILPQRKGHHLVLVSNDFDLGENAMLEVFETSIKGKVKQQTFTRESHSLYLTSAASLLLHFRAGKNEGIRARGLVIEFSYEAATWSDTATRSSDCVTTISSENGKNGNFSSRQFSSKGGSHLPSKCRVVLQGFPKERISVKFVYFNLFVPDDKNSSLKCSDVDHLTADVRVGSRLSRIDDAWCGSRLPPNIMSSTNMMQLEYTTKSSRILRESSSTERGFRLQYTFHTDWNMGHMQAKVDKNKVCRFIFNSTVQSSGKLWSINHPGLYPRNLYCEYIFHGSEDQVVHIHFEYFDVEGFNQCDEQTQSDYVLFSNYQTHDRTNRRFCGKVAPRGPILSESNYFRMIFFTNDIFDSTGFYAHYQFISQPKSQISRIKLTLSSSSTTVFSYVLSTVISIWAIWLNI